MSLGVVAIVGSPNVGKSTIFNRIVGKRRAIVDDQPGVTRDRLYETAEWLDREFRLVDTGGIEIENRPFQEQIRVQTQLAIDEADVIVFVVDGKEDLTGYISIDLPLDRDLIFEMFQEFERKIFGRYITKQESELKYKDILDGEYSNTPNECSIEADNIYLITYSKYLGRFDFTIYLYECNKKMILDDG